MLILTILDPSTSTILITITSEHTPLATNNQKMRGSLLFNDIIIWFEGYTHAMFFHTQGLLDAPHIPLGLSNLTPKVDSIRKHTSLVRIVEIVDDNECSHNLVKL
jgi:hypothetical protein